MLHSNPEEKMDKFSLNINCYNFDTVNMDTV